MLIIIVILLILSYMPGNENSEALVIHDTAIVTRYEKEVKRDTIIRWFERLKYIRNKPEEIHYQKADSNIIESFKEKDLIFKIDKKADELIIKTLNQRNEKIKEYRFDDAGGDFTLISQTNNIFLKSKNFYFDGIDINIGYDIYKDKKLYLDITSGINWRERVHLRALTGYDLNKKVLNAGINIGIKIIK